MKTSVIRQRVADFLKQHPPFDGISDEDLLDLAGSGKVFFHESDEYVYRQTEGTGKFVWIIQQGHVALLDEASGGERVRDLLCEGDVLGLERLSGGAAYVCSARTKSDVILYAVAASAFEALIVRYPAVKRFLAAHHTVSGILGFDRKSWLEADAPPLDFLRSRLVALSSDVSVAQAWAGLSGSRSGFVAIVDDYDLPKGTITARDLWESPEHHIRPNTLQHPSALAPPLSTRAITHAMLRSRNDHLLITADGTLESHLIALVTSAELSMFAGFDPAGLVREIRHADSVAEVEALLTRANSMVVNGVAQPQDVDDCGFLASEVLKAVAGACIGMAERRVLASSAAPAEVPYCLVMFGAMARGDLLALKLPAIAVVYDDSHEDFKSEDTLYFAALAGETLTVLDACGLSGAARDWPEGSAPSMPLSEWVRFYKETIRNPVSNGLYARREFFDLSPLSGDETIFEKLHDYILFELHDHETAIALLANDTLMQLPPLTFFRGLVMGLDGVQRENFSIDEAVVAPLADAARVLQLAKGRLAPANTLKRFDAAVLDFPAGAAVISEAAEAFRIGLYYRTLVGKSRITPGTLGKFDQLLLKTAFSSIHRFLEFTHSAFVEMS
jgi:CBS domain-containing protein